MAVAHRSVVRVALALAFLTGCKGTVGGTSTETTDTDVTTGDTGLTSDDGPMGGDPSPGGDPVRVGGDYGGFGDVDEGDPGPAQFGLDARPANTTCQAFTAPPAAAPIAFVNRFPQVTFDTPVSMTQAPADTGHFYVNQRDGEIFRIVNDPASSEKIRVLDLSDVEFTGIDCSAASLVFAPDFATSHAVYVDYCYAFPPAAGTTTPRVQVRLSRFKVAVDGVTFDRSSEQVLIAINYHESNDPPECSHLTSDEGLHAGDAAHFGPDGKLWMAVGDGGPQGVCGGKQAQMLSSLRGKLLRFDVSNFAIQVAPEHTSFEDGAQYADGVTALTDNPFFDQDPNPLTPTTALIWAYGLRNPWQWHFDTHDGAIWLGDVGNDTYEEVNRAVQKGGNYGWGYYEGFHCSNGWTAADCAAYAQCTAGFTSDACDAQVTAGNLVATYSFPPFLEYSHGSNSDQGAAVSGGLVYRGSSVPAYTGSYFFGDSNHAHTWVVQNVDSLAQTGGNCSQVTCPEGLVCMDRGAPFTPNPTGAVDPDGAEPRCEAVKVLVPTTGDAPASFFQDAAGDLYEVNLAGSILRLESTDTSGSGGPPTLLSQTGCFQPDDARVPVSDLVAYAPAAELWSDGATKRRWMSIPADTQITMDADGDFEFPAGTVLVKEFSLAGQRVETRFLVRQNADGAWAGYTYEWNDAGTDATLVAEPGGTKTWGTQMWSYPGRSRCFDCHTPAAGMSLGPEAAQLNHLFRYEASSRDANQMSTLIHIGMLDPSGYAPPYPSLASIADTTRTIEARARSYLHVNCSICHRPNGPTFTPADLRYETPFGDMSICNQDPTVSNLEGLITPPPPPKLFLPGDPGHSEIYVRMQTNDPRFRMPPLARTITHQAAVDVIGQWITQTAACPGQ